MVAIILSFINKHKAIAGFFHLLFAFNGSFRAFSKVW